MEPKRSINWNKSMIRGSLPILLETGDSQLTSLEGKARAKSCAEASQCQSVFPYTFRGNAVNSRHALLVGAGSSVLSFNQSVLGHVPADDNPNTEMINKKENNIDKKIIKPKNKSNSISIRRWFIECS